MTERGASDGSLSSEPTGKPYHFTFRISFKGVHWITLATSLDDASDGCTSAAYSRLQNGADALIEQVEELAGTRIRDLPELFIAYKRVKASLKCTIMWLSDFPPWGTTTPEVSVAGVEIEATESISASMLPLIYTEKFDLKKSRNRGKPQVLPRFIRTVVLTSVRDRVAMFLAILHGESALQSPAPLAVWAAWDHNNVMSIMMTVSVVNIVEPVSTKMLRMCEAATQTSVVVPVVYSCEAPLIKQLAIGKGKPDSAEGASSSAPTFDMFASDSENDTPVQNKQPEPLPSVISTPLTSPANFSIAKRTPPISSTGATLNALFATIQSRQNAKAPGKSPSGNLAPAPTTSSGVSASNSVPNPTFMARSISQELVEPLRGEEERPVHRQRSVSASEAELNKYAGSPTQIVTMIKNAMSPKKMAVPAPVESLPPLELSEHPPAPVISSVSHDTSDVSKITETSHPVDPILLPQPTVPPIPPLPLDPMLPKIPIIEVLESATAMKRPRVESDGFFDSVMPAKRRRDDDIATPMTHDNVHAVDGDYEHVHAAEVPVRAQFSPVNIETQPSLGELNVTISRSIDTHAPAEYSTLHLTPSLVVVAYANAIDGSVCFASVANDALQKTQTLQYHTVHAPLSLDSALLARPASVDMFLRLHFQLCCWADVTPLAGSVVTTQAAGCSDGLQSVAKHFMQDYTTCTDSSDHIFLRAKWLSQIVDAKLAVWPAKAACMPALDYLAPPNAKQRYFIYPHAQNQRLGLGRVGAMLVESRVQLLRDNDDAHSNNFDDGQANNFNI